MYHATEFETLRDLQPCFLFLAEFSNMRQHQFNRQEIKISLVTLLKIKTQPQQVDDDRGETILH